MKFSVDPWDPAYGVANELGELDPTSGEVAVDVERAAADWRPIEPQALGPAQTILFVDGVRRVEARVWLHDTDGNARAGICASYAAGAVRCDGAAHIGPVRVERGLFTSTARAEAVVTTAGVFPVRLATNEAFESLVLALQERMGLAEQAVTVEACHEAPADLVVVDGPLRGRQDLTHAVGYVKTHHVAYLPSELHAMVGRIAPGQRSPLFLLATSWSRLAWYFRLPGPTDAPWAGVVRGECSPDIPVTEAAALADRVTATLQRFASEPHKEPRAPQNLYPIAGLERELRRRLGDPQLLYRALRRSAKESTIGATVGAPVGDPAPAGPTST
jgi:hypothetical protein